MKKLLLLLLLFNCKQTKAQTYVLIPDANFASYLQGLIPSAMNGSSLNTSSSLVTTITQTINVNNLGISNIMGVQYFSSLVYLDCGNNSLTSLPTLPNSLNHIDCSGNSLTSLPTLPNSLSFLNCNFNSLTNLPTLPTSLTYLYCNSNIFAGIPALPNGIIHLECTFTSIHSLPSLPNSLAYLDCGYNYLTSLPTLPNSLTYLSCDANSLTSLPAIPISVQTLYCHSNSLTALPPLNNTGSVLHHLYCNNNNITCFPVFPASLTNINLNANPFNCLPNFVLPAMNAYTATPICVVGNSNGCEVAGLKEFNANNNQISIYPNPTIGEFIIETTFTEKETMNLFDVNGKLVFSQNINGKTNIDASFLNAGVYNLTLKNSEGIANKKLVIVR